jgi:predicted nucleotidyltransferase component of viral defense system
MKEVAKSIRQRLLNLSKTKQIDYNVLLIRYFHERFLYRLSLSTYHNSFYLKGGALLYALSTQFPRPTIDIDLLGIKIKNDHDNLLNIFTDICKTEFPEDGVIFDYHSIKTTEISISKKYPGIRISLIAYLDTIRQQLQIDIGFGDKSAMQTIFYPKLLDTLPSAEICAYSVEYIVAEKFHAMIFLSELNSRYKDFYDVYMILSQQGFDKEKLTEAIKHTFQTRSTGHEENHPLFSETFVNDKNRLFQWKYFLKKINVPDLDFSHVVNSITEQLYPIYNTLNE